EIDSERRRLSLSIKRVEGQVLPVRPIVPPTEADLDDVPELGLSEDVFAGADEHVAPEAVAEPEAATAEREAAAAAEPEAAAAAGAEATAAEPEATGEAGGAADAETAVEPED